MTFDPCRSLPPDVPWSIWQFSSSSLREKIGKTTMVQVRVSYRAQFRSAAGCSDEVVEVSPKTATVHDLLQTLAQRHDGLRPLLFDADGNRRGSAMLFVNDKLCAGDASLADGAQVTLLAPMAGG